jgi:hypothetical protein
MTLLSQHRAEIIRLEAERDRLRAELRQAHEALTLIRSRLPQPCLDDFCDWQRGLIDGVLGPGSDAGGEGNR